MEDVSYVIFLLHGEGAVIGLGNDDPASEPVDALGNTSFLRLP
jgi:hypothetical protein